MSDIANKIIYLDRLDELNVKHLDEVWRQTVIYKDKNNYKLKTTQR